MNLQGSYTVSSRSNSSTGNLYKPLRSQHPTKLNTNEKNIAVTGTLNHFVQSKKLPVKNEELKNLLWLLQPGVPLPSADTIKNEIIKSFDKEHCWTSANTIPFLGITSHWINIDWQLQETLIDFVKLSGPHSGDNLREAFVASSVESVGRADRYMIKWVLNEEEWSKLVEISQLLHLFSRATKHISTNHYPTLTSTVLIFNWLIDNLEDYEHNLNGTSDIKGKVKEVIEKLKFYYIRTDASVYTIATNNNWEANFINNAHQVIKDIYQSGYAPNLTVFSNPENNDIEEEEDLTAHIYKHQQINHESEYPHLALMARDYLAIPATSVPVERIFSGGTDLVTATRCSLSASTIRACMCLRYWWKGVLKNQL
ncbi:17423_t:CDS:2 [Entrophospora sp. SA101]|nr:17423_t:CDS:2 [Entrophospora sp. SA101]